MLAFVPHNTTEASMQTRTGDPLLQALAQAADCRKSRGKRQPLVAILSLICAARLCGASSLTAISQWVGTMMHWRSRWRRSRRWIWAAGASPATAVYAEGPGAQDHARYGDDLLTVRADQPTLREDIATLFDDPPEVAGTPHHSVHRSAWGRIVGREVRASSALRAEYTGWRGLRQVFRLGRLRIDKRTGQREHTIVYGITSLCAKRADARDLAAIVRGHGSIENCLNWVRDAKAGEYVSRIRSGQTPQSVAVFRHIAISALGRLAYDSLREGLRHCAWNAPEGVSLVIARPKMAA
jgi:predicted transposase YbfD/YdcC